MPRALPPSDRPSTTSRATSNGDSPGGQLVRLIEALPAARLRQVFMHPSRVLDRAQSYERLEFLGDSALGFIVARALYERYPGVSEGTLSRLRSSVVSRKSCARRRARDRPRPDVRGAVRVDGRPAPLGQRISALTEAAIAALVLEHGIEPVSAPVLDAFEHQISEAEIAPVDHKTLLQEEAAKVGLEGELRGRQLRRAAPRADLHLRGDR